MRLNLNLNQLVGLDEEQVAQMAELFSSASNHVRIIAVLNGGRDEC